MINFEISTLVDRPIDEVFNFISNPLNMPKWQVMVAKVEQLIPGVIGIGSKFNVKAGMLGRAMDGVMEITEYEPPTKFAFTNRLGPIQMKVAVMLKPVGTGAKITVHAQGNPDGMFKIAEGPMAQQIKIQMEMNLEKLKSILETML
jgi:carbon monoxide dehydrogenase subunit G